MLLLQAHFRRLCLVSVRDSSKRADWVTRSHRLSDSSLQFISRRLADHVLLCAERRAASAAPFTSTGAKAGPPRVDCHCIVQMRSTYGFGKGERANLKRTQHHFA